MAVVAEFLAEMKGRLIGYGKKLAAVSAALENSPDKLLVLPGQAANEDCDLVALFGRKRSFLGSPVLSPPFNS